VFIRQGRLILDCPMENVAGEFIELLVSPGSADAARALGPIHEQEVFGRRLMLFRGRRREELSPLGELRTPGVADLFVALMKGGQA
jgi:ABC-2 type transport system ATP-binding protein